MKQWPPEEKTDVKKEKEEIHPKILEYVGRIKYGGETLESFGEIPDSWKGQILEQLDPENLPEINGSSSENMRTGAKDNLDQPETLILSIEEKEAVLREYLLEDIDSLYTKPSARNAARNLVSRSGKELYDYALTSLYQSIRMGEYDRNDPLYHFDVEALTTESNDLIKRVQQEGGWHFRIPTTSTTANKSEGRISLNVVGNKQLIERLDALAHKYGVYYKTPDQSENWNERNDPVTIYINNPDLTPDQIEDLKREVVSQTEPFIRGNDGFGIYGDNLSVGVEFGPESSPEEIQRLKQEAAKISPDLEKALDSYLRKNGKEKSSVGQNIAAQKLINMLR